MQTTTTATTSIARRLLQRLLPAMVLTVIVSAAVAYLIAHQAAMRAYDRALLENARAVAKQVRISGGEPSLELSSSAQQILLSDEVDTEYFEVIDASGKTVAGDPQLPRPPGGLSGGDGYHDAIHKDQRVRVATLTAESGDVSFTVLTAETVIKRERLVREILLAMMIPEVLLIVASVFLVRLGVRRGLTGIARVREQLARRSHADLRPLTLADIPEELQPLLGATNDLLQRLAVSVETERHLIANASHQLRTPIAALQAEAEMALRSDDPRAGLERVVAGIRRVAHLAHQLLVLSRLDHGHMPMKNDADLVSLLHEAANAWMPRAIRKDIDLGFDLQPATVRGEAVWLEELANNLVDNAIRYTPAGGVVTVRCGTAAGAAWFEVEDNGPGIPEAERERVFERFHRLQEGSTEGSGLGLAIVREAARAHGGTVHIEAGAEGCGTRVRVDFAPNQDDLSSSMPSS